MSYHAATTHCRAYATGAIGAGPSPIGSPLSFLAEERAVIWQGGIFSRHLIKLLGLDPVTPSLNQVIRLVISSPLGRAVSINLFKDLLGSPNGDAVLFVIDDFVFFHFVFGGFENQYVMGLSNFKHILNFF